MCNPDCLSKLAESLPLPIPAENKEGHVKSEEIGKDMASVQTLLAKLVR